MSKAIRASGDFVFMQGQVGTLLDGTFIGENDPGAQIITAELQAKWKEPPMRMRCTRKLAMQYRPAVYCHHHRTARGIGCEIGFWWCVQPYK